MDAAGSSAIIALEEGWSMRHSLHLPAVLLAAATVAAGLAVVHGQAGPITNPIPNPIVKRGLSVEIKDLVRLPDTRGLRPADQDVTPAGWARVSFVRDLPDGRRFANDSRGFLYLLDAQQPADRLRQRRRGLSDRDLQPARERLHRVRVSSRVRAQRPVLHGARRKRAQGNPTTPNFIPPASPWPTSPTTTSSRSGTRRTRRRTRSRARGANCFASATSSRT